MRLLLGDCLELMRALPDGSVDAVIADPPYGTTACKWDAVIPFAPMWEQLRRVAKPNAATVLFAAQPFTSALVMSNPREFRYDWVWHKSRASGHLNAKHRPMQAHEHIVVFGRREPSYFPQMVAGNPYRIRRSGTKTGAQYGAHTAIEGDYDGQRWPRSVQEYSPGANGTKLHPTQKPVDLLAYLVRTYTNPGDTVLDFCMGSGTTGVACAQEGRDFIGIERERAYYEIAQRRIAAAQPPLFAEVAD
jgi:site-specific DNA-methyltransferase (adenine-specific)